jgi:hypothetical protein
MLHESSLFELFGSVWDPVVLGCNLVNHSKCTLANSADFIVLGASLPLLNMST